MATAKQGGKSKSSSEHRKSARSASWARGEKTKDARRAAQQERAAANRERRRNGEPTPWEIACQERSQRRAEAARTKVGGKS